MSMWISFSTTTFLSEAAPLTSYTVTYIHLLVCRQILMTQKVASLTVTLCKSRLSVFTNMGPLIGRVCRNLHCYMLYTMHRKFLWGPGYENVPRLFWYNFPTSRYNIGLVGARLKFSKSRIAKFTYKIKINNRLMFETNNNLIKWTKKVHTLFYTV